MNHDEFREKLLASFLGLRQHTHRLTTSSDDADDLLQYNIGDIYTPCKCFKYCCYLLDS